MSHDFAGSGRELLAQFVVSVEYEQVHESIKHECECEEPLICHEKPGLIHWIEPIFLLDKTDHKESCEGCLRD